jgi:uncharacterized membrane protein YgcG
MDFELILICAALVVLFAMIAFAFVSSRRAERKREEIRAASRPADWRRPSASLDRGDYRRNELYSAPPVIVNTPERRRDDDDFDAAGFAIGMATGVPLSPSKGISTGSMLGAALHSDPSRAEAPRPRVVDDAPIAMPAEVTTIVTDNDGSREASVSVQIDTSSSSSNYDSGGGYSSGGSDGGGGGGGGGGDPG